MRVLLTTLHAKYVHSSLALPCLAAACTGIGGVETVIREFTVNEPRDEILRRIVGERPDVAAFSCYIWNIEQTLRLVSDLKQLLPGTVVVLGGPEVSFGTFELMERHPSIDCVVKGEGEETFRELIATLARAGTTPELHNSTTPQLPDIPGLLFRSGDDIVATPERGAIADLDTVPSPFALGLVDLAKPLVYLETSRGCPFSCAFCMSSLEKGVRSFSPERVRDDLRLLMEQGVRTVKLVDRTFNFDPRRANEIWDFILRTNRETSFHFEIAADLLTGENLRLLERVPPGMFRFEIGVQSGNEETLDRVGRRSDLERLSTHVRRLVATTGVTVHLDLVAGLPHEDYGGFLDSLQRVFDLLDLGEPQQCAAGRRKKTDCFVQVEPLKVLKGSPMRRIALDEGYRFSHTPPYKILSTPWLSFEEVGRIEAISRHLDLFVNSGRFGATLVELARVAPLSRIFDRLARFREERLADAARSLVGLFDYLWEFGETVTTGNERERVREALCYDYCLAECPVAGKEPGFFREGDGRTAAKVPPPTQAELAERLGIEKGSRIRTHCRRFGSDPRQPGEQGGEVELTFVYVSAPGKGLDVRVFPSIPERFPRSRER